MNRYSLLTLCALASTVLAVVGTPAHAALGGASGIVIPYAGKLELNGALVTGTVVFRFEVLESSAPPTVCQTKEIPDVPVTNGEFAVTISGVSEACVKGKDVHLQIAVKQGLDSFVVLGKQRVTPVLGAVTSGPGDFAVTGALTAKSLVVSDPQSTLVADFNGLAIGRDTIKAAGSATNQDIILVPKGSGVVEVTGSLLAPSVVVNGPLRVTGAVDVPANSITGPMLRADPLDCITESFFIENTGGGFKQVQTSLSSTFYTRTGGGCDCGTTTTSAGRLMVVNRPSGTDGWACACKDHVSGDATGRTTVFVTGCRLP
jgi:hypothetical protein